MGIISLVNGAGLGQCNGVLISYFHVRIEFRRRASIKGYQAFCHDDFNREKKSLSFCLVGYGWTMFLQDACYLVRLHLTVHLV